MRAIPSPVLRLVLKFVRWRLVFSFGLLGSDRHHISWADFMGTESALILCISIDLERWFFIMCRSGSLRPAFPGCSIPLFPTCVLLVILPRAEHCLFVLAVRTVVPHVLCFSFKFVRRWRILLLLMFGPSRFSVDVLMFGVVWLIVRLQIFRWVCWWYVVGPMLFVVGRVLWWWVRQIGWSLVFMCGLLAV